MKSKIPRLGELELAVLEHLWSSEEADVAETHANVGQKRAISPNTVGSALERLYRKGLVNRHKVSHAFRYRAALSKNEFAAQKLVDAAGGLSSLSRAGVLAAFVDLVADVDEDALDRLEALIAKKKKHAGSET